VDTNITFEPSGKSSLVAEGRTVLGAARSLGVEIPAECGGIGKCDSCGVFIENGADGLSELTDGERTYLSETRLAEGERLACQVHVMGLDVTVRVPEIVKSAKTEGEKETVNDDNGKRAKANLREEFDKLPFTQKMAALADFEINAAGQMVGVIFSAAQRVGSELFSMFSSGSKSENPQEQPHTETENTDSDGSKGNDQP
jgi:uncharacterized 2Fe-2S/4Fe-4S cluster protein (DUF4445 family)